MVSTKPTCNNNLYTITITDAIIRLDLFEENAFAKILVAIDGSEQSMKAADSAISLADKYNAKLIAVHVIDLSQPKLGGDTSGLITGVINPLAELEAAKKESLHWLNNVGELAGYGILSSSQKS